MLRSGRPSQPRPRATAVEKVAVIMARPVRAEVCGPRPLAALDANGSVGMPVGLGWGAPALCGHDLPVRRVPHNYDIDGLMRLVDEFIDFKRAGDESLSGAEAVRRQYLEDWEGHAQVVVTVNRIFVSESSAAIEIHVESGPPSNVWYDGVVRSRLEQRRPSHQVPPLC